MSYNYFFILAKIQARFNSPLLYHTKSKKKTTPHFTKCED